MNDDQEKSFGECLQEMQSLDDYEINEWAEKQMRRGGGTDERKTERFNRIKAARTIKQEREAKARLNGKSGGKWLLEP